MLDREKNDVFTEGHHFGYEHAVISATTSIPLRTVRAPLRCDRAEYVNTTGFATVDPANFWTINVLRDAVVVASWSTNAAVAGVSGLIPVNTFFDLALSATDANRVFPGTPSAQNVYSVQFVKTGAPANLPLGRFFFHNTLV